MEHGMSPLGFRSVKAERNKHVLIRYSEIPKFREFTAAINFPVLVENGVNDVILLKIPHVLK